jgi:hypothetical protein
VKSDHAHYVPCLRWKQGEYQAVMRLLPATKDHLTPLIDVPEIGWDFETGTDAKTLDEHLETFATRVRTKWGQRPCFVDGRLLPPGGKMISGEHAMSHIFRELRSGGCSAIPVTGPDRDPSYQSAVKDIVSEDRRRVCLRVPLSLATKRDFANSSEKLLTELGTECNIVDFVLDLGAPTNFTPLEGFCKLVRRLILSLPRLKDWRTLTLLGTSFPKTMGDVKTSPDIRERFEWVLYKQVVADFQKSGDRIPAFGDYAIQHPDLCSLDMRRVKPAASIRYSADDIWYIIKGPNVRDHKFEQYRVHCKTLIGSPHYAGPTYSYGDKYISDCARGVGKTGSLMTWRCVGTNHHLEKVVRDIASFFGSSSTP